MYPRFNGDVRLHHLLYRLKKDKKFLEEKPEKRDMFERRIERHKKDILEYVTSENFEYIANVLNI